MRNFDIDVLCLANANIAQQILNLQRVSYYEEAILIDFQDIPPLSDTLESLQNCQETFCGYHEDGKIVGAVSYKITDKILDIHRLMVHPDYFRRGIAKSLLQFVESHNTEIVEIVVTTPINNTPAVNLYKKMQYEIVAKKSVAENLQVYCFSKSLGG